MFLKNYVLMLMSTPVSRDDNEVVLKTGINQVNEKL